MEPDKKSSEEFSEYHVDWIKDRIDSEFRKHSRSEGLDWSLIAAKKIVATFKEKYTLLNKNES
jgi:hypothetical protein